MVYKLFRKKDIKVNGHWQDAKYVISSGEEITIFIKDEQYDEFKKKQEDTHQKFEDEAKKNTEEGKRQMFNMKFTNVAGTKNGAQVNNIIDDVIESNKIYDKKIAVVFNGDSTIEESKLVEIKHNIEEWDKYEVSINYDENKYVNEVKIDKVS